MSVVLEGNVEEGAYVGVGQGVTDVAAGAPRFDHSGGAQPLAAARSRT
jgi:hypothetical protein